MGTSVPGDGFGGRAGVDQARVVDAREREADLRDELADARERDADLRDELADARDREADLRDELADAREREADARELQLESIIAAG